MQYATLAEIRAGQEKTEQWNQYAQQICALDRAGKTDQAKALRAEALRFLKRNHRSLR